MTPGDILSHYRILGPLGAGGMGEVFKAEDTRLKRLVAIKVLPASLNEQSEAKQRLIVEAQAASALDHPNICTIYEVDETTDGRVFLVMAYYEGETLAKRLARGPVGIDESIDILLQLTRGVAAAHDAGVIHRDIKPANVFLTARPAADSSRVKLLDFGIAKLADQTGLTRTGTTIGTMAYMAPEHIGGHAIDQRADLWSIGVVLYELISGRQPFDNANPMAIINAIANDNPAPLSSIVKDTPAAVEAIAQRALRKRVDDRYQNARELLADLESFRNSRLAPTAAMPVVTSAVPSKRRMNAVVAIAASVAVIAGGVWMFQQRVRANEITQTVSDVRTLVETEKYSGAFRRIHSVPPAIASDPAIVAAERDYFLPMRILTDPPGADVFVKGYDEADAEWISLGASPIATRVPVVAANRWKVSKAGYETFEGSGVPSPAANIRSRCYRRARCQTGWLRFAAGRCLMPVPYRLSSSIATKSPTRRTSNSWTPAAIATRNTGRRRL